MGEKLYKAREAYMALGISDYQFHKRRKYYGIPKNHKGYTKQQIAQISKMPPKVKPGPDLMIVNELRGWLRNNGYSYAKEIPNGHKDSEQRASVPD